MCLFFPSPYRRGVRGNHNPLPLFLRGRIKEGVAFFLLLLSSSPASAQFTLLYQKDGDTANAWLGGSVASAGDVNGDGKADFIIGAYNASPGGDSAAGSAYVYSGADGSLLFQKDGAAVGDALGDAVAGAGDLNGDGKADFIIGAFAADPGGLGNAGAVYVYSGATGALLFQKDGVAANDLFGTSVASAGDVNGDGRVDFIVGAYTADPGGFGNAGSAYLYSGLDGSLLYQKNGATAGDFLGVTVASAGDVNGDGRADFIIGAPRADPGGLDTAGSAYLYSGLDGSLLYQKNGTAAGDALGVSVNSAGDVNGDGRADFLVGAAGTDPGGLTFAGSAYLYSGLDGSLLYQKNGASASDELGYSVASAGDVNGDGRPDFLVGALWASPGGVDCAGSAYLYSGLDGSLLFQKDGTARDEELGNSVASAGDVNGDGRADFIVGAIGANPGGNTYAGSAFVYSLPAPPDPPVNLTPIHQKNGSVANNQLGISVAGAGDINGDGKADFIVGAHGAFVPGVGQAGSAYVYSGSTGSIIYQKDGTINSEQLGYSVAGAGDVNGDGRVDFIIGAHSNNPSGLTFAGSAFVYSGVNGVLLYQKDGADSGDNFGYSVAGAGDVNGDGKADFIIGAPNAIPGGLDQVGSAYVYSGADGTLLYRKDGTTAHDEFGVSVAGAGDVDGDGRADFIVGAIFASPGGDTSAGSVFVYSGLDGSLLYQKNGPTPFDEFGISVAGAGDVNGDGRADFIVGAYRADPGGLFDAGSAFVYSGQDGALLYRKDGTATDTYVGLSVGGGGDVNGDGRSDFVVGAPIADPGGLLNAGSVFVYSGQNGTLLSQQDGGALGDGLGQSVAITGDVNADGKADYIVGAYGASPSGLIDAGSAFVFAVNRKPLLAPVGNPTGTEGQLLTFTVSASDPDGFLPMLSLDSITKPTGAAFVDTGNGGGKFVWTPAPYQVGVHHARFIASDGFLTDSQLVTITVLADTLKSQKNGANIGDQLGFAVAGGGDVDGDGVADYIIGAPFTDVQVFGEATALTDAGSAFVYSGKNDTLIYRINGIAAGERVGGSVGLYGDANLDGVSDFIVGAPGANDSAGKAIVYSGATGLLLFQKIGASPGDRVGGSVGLYADVDGDGKDDFIVGAPGTNSSTGSAYVYSGADGSLLFQKNGSTPGDRVGGSVGISADVNSVNGDNRADFIVGAPGVNSSTGAAYVYSGLDGSLLFTKIGASPGERVGGSVGFTQVSDVNGDNHSDFIIGADGVSSSSGAVYVYSGQTGGLLFQKTGSSPGDRVGGSVGIQADVDGDGRTDFIVGAPGGSPGGKDSAGSAFIYSGLNGALLFQKNGDSTGDRVGGSVGIFSNASGTQPRFLIGAPNADPGGNQDAGSAFLFQPIQKGDLNGDGILTASDIVCMLNCTFLGSAMPPCRCDLTAADITCEGFLTAADVVKEINAVFLGTSLNCSL